MTVVGRTDGQGRDSTNWTRLVVTLLIGALPTAICFILGWWWWGTVFMLIALLVACFSFAPSAHALVFTLYAVFAIAWLTGGILDGALSRSGASGGGWRGAAPAWGGLLIGLSVTSLVWFVTLAISTVWILGVSDSRDVSWRQGLGFVAARVFGIARPYVLVENGKMTLENRRGLIAGYDGAKYLPQFGGPGMLVVREGNVVVLERGSKISRVLGQGEHALKQGEWFKQPTETKGIHDLRGSFAKPRTLKGVMTKDGIPLDITIGGGCRLELKKDTDKRPASRFPGGESSSRVIGEPGSGFEIYEATVLKAVQSTPDEGWKSMILTAAMGPLYGIIATYRLRDIFPFAFADASQSGSGSTPSEPDTNTMKTIEGAVKDRIDLSSYGVVGGVYIAKIEVPDNVREQMFKRWAAPVERAVRLQEAALERDVMIEKSEAKAKSIEVLEGARLGSSRAFYELLSQLAENVTQVRESPVVAYGFLEIVRDLFSRIGVDQEADIRRLRALQEFAAAEGARWTPYGAGRGPAGPFLGEGGAGPATPAGAGAGPTAPPSSGGGAASTSPSQGASSAGSTRPPPGPEPTREEDKEQAKADV
jgi:hypothetical protein